MTIRRVVIVGAGVSGLAVAFRLQARRPDADIVVLERAERPGGTTWSERENGFHFEHGPNGFLDTAPATLDLARDLGLDDQLVTASPTAGTNRYLFLDGRLKLLPNGFGSFVTTDLLGWRAKISLLWERFRGGRREDGDESIDAFARRRAGDEAADVFADALVTGIFAGDPKLLSLPACFPRIAQMEREHGSVMKGFFAQARERRAAGRPASSMRSFTGGMRVLIDGLVKRLGKPPIFGVAVRAIQRDVNRAAWSVHGDRETWEADAVVLTCPAYQQAAILGDIDKEIAEMVAGIPYNRVAVVAMGYRAADVPSMDGFGFIAPQNTRRDLLGVQWCSSIYPQRAPDGSVLMRAMCGGWQRADVVDWHDARLLEAMRHELKLAMNVTAAPIYHKIIRWDKAIPQYHLGHLDRVARIDARLTQHPGLFLGGNAYRGVALNDCTEQGAILAERVASFLAPERK
jgi:oxygen-dependent protoporphyrinogen oxidase